MVGFSADRETVYAVDEVTSDAFTREEDALGGSRETRQTAGTTHTVLIPDRNGASRPLVLRESEPNVLGIVIIAEGGDSPFVRAELTRAARAVLGLEAHKIEVLTMRNG
jgi:stage III sporulation protein AG